MLAGSDHFLGVLTQYVQVLAGILLPSAVLFLALLCNDKEILGPWVNRTWQNVLVFAIVGVLVVLSLILVISTLFTSIDAVLLTEVLFGAAGAATVLVLIPLLLRSRARRIAAGGPRDRLADVERLDRNTWRMPPLEELVPPTMSAQRRVGLLFLRGYLVVAGLLVAVKVFSSLA